MNSSINEKGYKTIEKNEIELYYSIYINKYKINKINCFISDKSYEKNLYFQNISHMFDSSISLISIDDEICKWNTNNIIDISYIFYFLFIFNFIT